MVLRLRRQPEWAALTMTAGAATIGWGTFPVTNGHVGPITPNVAGNWRSNDNGTWRMKKMKIVT
jgi:hypothetical protein